MAFSIDTGTPFGRRAEQHLRDDLIGWLVTTSPRGAPQPSPVWYLWEGGEILLYSQPDTPKLRNIEANPRVAFHMDSHDGGEDIVILAGRARIVPDQPPADHVSAYLAKYASRIANNGWTPASFAADYSVAVRIEPTRLQGF
jgi:PPOX class probable F420-dependent enzyme